LGAKLEGLFEGFFFGMCRSQLCQCKIVH
jgi:hypothetical protein